MRAQTYCLLGWEQQYSDAVSIYAVGSIPVCGTLESGAKSGTGRRVPEGMAALDTRVDTLARHSLAEQHPEADIAWGP